MARDNPPKERQRRQLERKQGRRAPYDRILIVSEGGKTEPNYFNEIRKAYHLPMANIMALSSESGTTPLQVVQDARELFESGNPHKRILPRVFEQVFAVFERDDHDHYFKALKQAKSLDGKLKNDAGHGIHFQAIASIPCFELWLLLHYEDVHAPVHRNEVMRRLKQHIPDYEKGAENVFATTRDFLCEAKRRAKAHAKKFSADTDPEPFTAVVELVELLEHLKLKPP